MVSREKYEKAKDAARAWYEKYMMAESECSILKEDVEKWKKLSERLPDTDAVSEVEEQLKASQKAIRKLKKDMYEQAEQYKNTISNLNRDKILAEGRIQQLEEARKDLKDRYDELKQDYREQRKTAH